MDFSTYQTATDRTAIYPRSGTGSVEAINYCVLGAAGEAGEIANKWKKYFRGDYSLSEVRALMEKEMGDTLWYLARLALELGINFDDVAKNNLAKLEKRHDEEVLTGSGDNR